MTWSFFALIVVAAYTAKLAVWLSFYHPILVPTSFAQMVHENSPYRACLLDNSAYSKFLKASPKYKSIVQVGKKNLHAMVEGLVNGDCEAIIERGMHLEYVQDSGTFAHMGSFMIIDRMPDGPQQLAVMMSRSAQRESASLSAVKARQRAPYRRRPYQLRAAGEALPRRGDDHLTIS